MRSAEGRTDRIAVALLGVGMVAAAVYLIWQTRGFGYLDDEWYFWAGYHPLSPHNLLAPGNGNLIAIPILIYKAVFAVAGVSYVPLRVIEALVVLLNAGLFFVLAANGDRLRSWLALPPALLLLVYGSSWDSVATPLGITALVGMAFGLGAMLSVQRDTTRGDVLTAVLICAGLASFTTAVPLLVAVGVVILCDDIRCRPRRLLVVAVPAVLYLIYRWHYRDYPTLDGAKPSVDHALHMPTALLDSWRGLLESLAGYTRLQIEPLPALLLAVAVLALIAWRVWKGPPVNRRALAYGAALLTLWLSLGILGKDPIASRYQFPAAILFFLLVIELLDGLRIPRLALAAAAVAFGLAIVSNIEELDRQRFLTLSNTKLNEAKLAALEAIRGTVSPQWGLQRLAYPEDPFFADIYVITVGEYFEARDRYGSPAMSLADLAQADEWQRETADRLFFNGLRLIELAPEAPLRDCRRARREGSTWTIESGPLPGPGFGVRAGGADVSAQMRRYGDVYSTYPITFPARSSRWRQIPSDRSDVPWQAALSAAAPFALCFRRG